ncbi:MAG: ABC transporter ATP-binding protein [Acidimicrobiaceae bacterium]|uniref:ABC transporter ATP-binding protein n=1 Tax=Candidatus Poriferisodalis multihospitum TaxID=2983191 RepID=UPI002387F5D3|nr:ABC transporter ATP-binding protein [Candidatus Poriferisodalis multihospitum]MDE0134459.1 ABC transporter ATP-binding protein [Acidimicrobiaceae bacterium]MDE0321537.1 ABC transporter ATP-binding protein [Acidimicrobiaceae bacterium]MDE0496817.1 ABC transporter ATP-binding protein [Acidimicrobiaceae bacterium]
MLALEQVEVAYGGVSAVHGASISVPEGELVALIGPNGAGKSSLLNAVVGLHAPCGGTIRWHGTDVTGWPPQRMLRAGVALVPEHRRILTGLSVEENLLVAGIVMGSRSRRRLAAELMERFEVLGRKRALLAGLLSGGEAQQLAIARALMSRPNMLLMDEPALGLAPRLRGEVFGLLSELAAAGTTLLVVEQDAHRLLRMAGTAYIMRSGDIVASGPADVLAAREDLFEAFLGADLSWSSSSSN